MCFKDLKKFLFCKIIDSERFRSIGAARKQKKIIFKNIIIKSTKKMFSNFTTSPSFLFFPSILILILIHRFF